MGPMTQIRSTPAWRPAPSTGNAPKQARRSLQSQVSYGALLLVAPLISGCNLFDGKELSAEEAAREEAAACANTLDYLEQTAWPTVLGTNCIDCHTPGGPAPADGAEFVLLPAGYPNFQQRNLETLADISAYKVDGQSVLLLKPTGELKHGGGARVKVGSVEYNTLSTLVSKLESAQACEANEAIPEYANILRLSAQATFRKATLHLGYRLPTPEESEILAEQGESALPELIEGLFEEDAFYARLKDIFNDKLLAERYLAYSGYAANILDDTMYPEAAEPFDLIEDEEVRRKINRGLTHEPLDFIAYLVRNNLPFTDVVEGNYMVVSPVTAPYLNAEVTFDDPTNEDEWQMTGRRAFVEVEDDVYKLTRIPDAGILTSPIFLNRFPTTDTNRNRHRARVILDIFLGTDILKVGDRPLDPTEAGLYPNPTLNDPSCSSCHEILDPIAGAFQKFSDNDPERYEPGRSWYGEMKAAGYEDEQMPTDEISDAPRWLGKRIANDPRFPFAMVKIVYQGLMGRAPVEPPEDFDAPDYSARFQAWRDQESLFQAIGADFKDSDYNLRTIFRELVLSPIYRASGALSEPSEWHDIEIGQLGTARLSTPMLLARKIEATTGLPWTRGWDQSDNLMTDYRILYGGIDSDTVNVRLGVPNGVMAGVQWRMANEMACTLAAWEFWLPEDQRHLLTKVDIADVPGGASETKIRENIAYLHERILGENVSADSPEVDKTYELFQSTWTEGQALLADETDNVGTWLPWACQARINHHTAEEIPEGERLQVDENYTVRAWIAVLTYLLSDYKFLYE